MSKKGKDTELWLRVAVTALAAATALATTIGAGTRGQEVIGGGPPECVLFKAGQVP